MSRSIYRYTDTSILTAVKKTHLRFVTAETLADYLSLERHALLNGQEVVVLRQSRLALFVDHQDELDHGRYSCGMDERTRGKATRGKSRTV